jgi:hypothetical protein
VVPQGAHRDRTPPRGGVPARRECPKPRAKRPPCLGTPTTRLLACTEKPAKAAFSSGGRMVDEIL